MHILAEKNVFVFNQSKSIPVNKDQFKPYYTCHFILTRIYLYVCLFVFVALRPMSTAMVIAGRSVHLTTLFPGQA